MLELALYVACFMLHVATCPQVKLVLELERDTVSNSGSPSEPLDSELCTEPGALMGPPLARSQPLAQSAEPAETPIPAGDAGLSFGAADSEMASPRHLVQCGAAI